MNYNGRWEKIISNMKDFGFDEMILSSRSDIFYLTGVWIHTGERMAVLHTDAANRKTLLINKLFKGMVKSIEIPVEYYEDGENPISHLAEHIGNNKMVGIDKNWPSHFLLELMERRKDLQFKNISFILEEARFIKDNDEIERLRKSSQIADRVTEELLLQISENISEKQLADRVGKIFAGYGANSLAFDPAIAFGANSGDPTHEAGDHYCKKGDSLLIDIGAVFNDYCSDITRTVFWGNPDKEAEKVYQIVLEANLTAINRVRPGVRFSDIDHAARNVIEQYGYGRNFTHRTGHCIGIEDHENPSVSHDNDRILKPGMTFSIEPGIYLAGKCGVRIEDLVLVTRDGVEVLNKSPKNLRIIGE